MKILRYCFLLTIYSITVFGQDTQEERIQAGLNAMYQFDYHGSAKIFEKVLRDESFHSLAPLGYLASEWYLGQELTGFEDANRAFGENIDRMLALYDKKIESDPENADLIYYYGVCRGLKARILLHDKDWFGILRNGVGAIKYINKAYELDPENPDIILAQGVFNYYVGISSGYMKLAKWLLSVSGDRDPGLAQIKYAAQKGKYSTWEAASILAFAYLYYEAEYDSAAVWSQPLSDRFDRNPYFYLLAADSYIHQGDIAAADSCIHKLEKLLPELNNFTRETYQSQTFYLKGSLAFAKGEFEEANRLLSEYSENFSLEMDWQLGYAFLRLGKICDLKSNRETAVEYYKKCIELDNMTVACDEAEKYLHSPYK